MSRTILLFAFGVSVVLLSGCGSELPTVQGTVTLDSEPVPNATVVFESPDKPMATAKTDENGEYDVITASKRGMAAGEYAVKISAYKTRDGGSESPLPILRTPKKYNSSKTSGLTARISEGANKDVNFELTSKK